MKITHLKPYYLPVGFLMIVLAVLAFAERRFAWGIFDLVVGLTQFGFWAAAARSSAVKKDATTSRP